MPIINTPPIRQAAVNKEGTTPNSWAEWFNQVYTICFALQQSGETLQRPINNLWIGRMYFDTDLGIPVWYDGTNWVDASGNPV